MILGGTSRRNDEGLQLAFLRRQYEHYYRVLCMPGYFNNNGEMHNSVPVLSLLKPENSIMAIRTLRFVIPEHSGAMRAGLYLH
jgi:hypothetical protein